MHRLVLLCCTAALAACAMPAAAPPARHAPAPVALATSSPSIATATAGSDGPPSKSDPLPPERWTPDDTPPFTTQALNTFDEPWAMTFLPDGRALVTEKKGKLKLVNLGGAVYDITGVPTVAYGGQGGLGDVVLHPGFLNNRYVYLSYAEAGTGSTRGAVVDRFTLNVTATGGTLTDRKRIWTQSPKVDGEGHYSHRIAFGPDGMLWITSGERQKFQPAQDLSQNLGKVIRLFDDGRVPTDNPFADRGGIPAQVWSYGHRNLLGIAFDGTGQLWTHEMGPKGGDELNLIEKGSNYGWPIVSNGDNYDDTPIPDHITRPDLNAPELSWNPVIAPAGFIIYSGTQFPQWRGNGLIGGLASQALIRVTFYRNTAGKASQYPMGKRIREVEQGLDGGVYVLEDGVGGRLLRLVPKT